MFGLFKKAEMPSETLPGRAEAMPVTAPHYVNGNPIKGPFPQGIETIYVAMGCFWGAERLFWSIPGVYSTAVGYMAGGTPNPTYREVCSGQTGHTEAVMVAYDPAKVSVERLLKAFWEEHDPTQGMRQGNDVGTQYRSGIYCTTPAQYEAAVATRDAIEGQLKAKGMGSITSEIVKDAPEFYYAEEAHQQYLAKNPGGYCGLRGTGVTCAVPEAV